MGEESSVLARVHRPDQEMLLLSLCATWVVCMSSVSRGRNNSKGSRVWRVMGDAELNQHGGGRRFCPRGYPDPGCFSPGGGVFWRRQGMASPAADAWVQKARLSLPALLHRQYCSNSIGKL